jgi:hypothetical protein
MASRKTDVVRRSLFGAGDVDRPESTPAPSRKRSTRQSREPTDRVRTPRSQVIEDEKASGSEPRRQVERTAITVPSELLMRVKDAVAVLNGWPQQYTMARFVEEAFTAQLERLKREHNGGREFPITNRKIRTGRPPGT